MRGLLDLGSLKTWSVIVTIMGDLAARRGSRLSGPVLSALTDPMGLKPEALRVAIHRLRRDGWIDSEREGRRSLYRLTPHGLSRTRSVSERIYGTEAARPSQWHILLARSAEELDALGFDNAVYLNGRTALLPDMADASVVPPALLAWSIEPGQMPDWALACVVSSDLENEFAALSTVLGGTLDDRFGRDWTLVQSTAFRLLVLHNWRRLILRLGAGHESLLNKDWSGAECRVRVGDVLSRFPRPDAAVLLAQLTP